MRSLPYDFKFDYISSLGVIHHLDNPQQGLQNIVNQLNDGGLFFMHVYGEDYHRRRAMGEPEHNTDVTEVFGDVPADAYYSDAVAWGWEAGVTYGKGVYEEPVQTNCYPEYTYDPAIYDRIEERELRDGWDDQMKRLRSLI